MFRPLLFVRRFLLFALVALSSATTVLGQTAQIAEATSSHSAGPPLTERERQLLQRIDNLERRLAALEAKSSANTTEPAKPALDSGTTPVANVSAVPAATLTAASSSASGAPSTSKESSAPTLPGLLGPTNVTGSVDTYYGYDLNQPHLRSASFRPFDATMNQFSLNMAEVTLAKPPDASASRLGYDLSFGFGNAMNVVNSSSPGDIGFAQYMKEAYFSYLAPVGKGLQIDFGKIVSPAGAEVIDTKDNWNYSRSLLFIYAIPFYHFGMRAKYAFNDKYSLAGYVVNGWNDIIDNNTGKTYGASFAWTPNKKWSVTENYFTGPELPNTNSHWRQLTDSVVTYSPTSKLSFQANYDYARGDVVPTIPRTVMWNGIAAYVRYAINDRYAVAARYEYFEDRDGFVTGTAQHFNEFTTTFERVLAKHLITRWEYRRDMSNRATFAKSGGFTDHQDTFTGGLVYWFDLKEAK